MLVPQGIELRNFGSLVLFPYQYTSSKSISNVSRLYMEEDWEGTLEIDLDLGLPVPKLLDGKGLVSVMKLFVSNLNIELSIRFRDCKLYLTN